MNKIVYTVVGFGEEYISQIIYDTIKEEVRVVIRNIFRPGPNNCEWGFDPDMCIDEGIIVLTGVKKVFFDPNGYLINDLKDIEVEDLGDNLHKITFVSSYFIGREGVPATFSVIAEDGYLIDTKKPDEIITE